MLCITGDVASSKHTPLRELHKEACFSIFAFFEAYGAGRPEASLPIKLSTGAVGLEEGEYRREASMSQVMW